MTQCWRCIHRHTREEHPECYRRVSEVQFKGSKNKGKTGYQRRIHYMRAWQNNAETRKDAS